MMKRIAAIFTLLVICGSFTGCYRVSNDDDEGNLSLIPATNNPNMLPESGRAVLPGFGGL